jgi:hypothetical protein
MDGNDRKALYRSLAWLSKGQQLDEPVMHFFFSILAIESLSNYILSRKCKNTSPLAKFKASRRHDLPDRKSKKDCINRVLSLGLSNDPIKAVTDAYENCINYGTKKILKEHLNYVLASSQKSIDLLFKENEE